MFDWLKAVLRSARRSNRLISKCYYDVILALSLAREGSRLVGVLAAQVVDIMRDFGGEAAGPGSAPASSGGSGPHGHPSSAPPAAVLEELQRLVEAFCRTQGIPVPVEEAEWARPGVEGGGGLTVRFFCFFSSFFPFPVHGLSLQDDSISIVEGKTQYLCIYNYNYEKITHIQAPPPPPLQLLAPPPMPPAPLLPAPLVSQPTATAHGQGQGQPRGTQATATSDPSSFIRDVKAPVDAEPTQPQAP